jgi:hypothetical protein
MTNSDFHRSAGTEDAVEAIIEDMMAAWVGKKWRDAFKKDCSRLVDAARTPTDAQPTLGRSAILEEAARIAENGCLVPPDGGSPTEDEREMCESIATQIRLLKLKGAEEVFEPHNGSSAGNGGEK